MCFTWRSPSLSLNCEKGSSSLSLYNKMKLETHSLTDVSPYPCVAIPVITMIRPISTFNQGEPATSTAARYPGGQLVKFSLAL